MHPFANGPRPIYPFSHGYTRARTDAARARTDAARARTGIPELYFTLCTKLIGWCAHYFLHRAQTGFLLFVECAHGYVGFNRARTDATRARTDDLHSTRARTGESETPVRARVLPVRARVLPVRARVKFAYGW